MLALIAWTGENYPSRGLYFLQKAYYIAITLTPCSGAVMNKLMDWDPPKSNVVRNLKRNLYHAIVFLHLIISRSKFMLSFMKSFASYIYNRPPVYVVYFMKCAFSNVFAPANGESLVLISVGSFAC